MSEPTQHLQFPKDVSITRCCGSCKHGHEAYGYEWFCDINTYKREVLGKVITTAKGTKPYYICKYYRMAEYLEREIKNGGTG